MTDTATPETSDPAADLALIRRMMHEGRQAATVDGTHLLIWGTLLGLGFLGQFVVITRGHGGASATVWAPVILIGWVLSFWLGYRQGRTRPQNKLTKLYAIAFQGVGIVMTLYFITGLVGEGVNGVGVTLLACGVIGLAFFVMGEATDLGWLKGCAFGWWTLMAYVSLKGTVLLPDLLILCAACWLLITVPGLRLMRMRRRPGDAASASA